MKMDMSGGAAVLEAVAAIAELGLAIDVLAVVPATENMPSGHATKPGDIITQHNGRTVEINNTDAEGRLILADALSYCARAGRRADRRPRDADRRGADRARLDLRGADLQRRRAGPRRVRAGGRGTRRARLAAAASPRVQGADQGHGRPTSPTRRRSARRGRSTPASFLEEFVDGGRGPTSTSPAPPGTSAASTSARARPASASGCWSRWRASSPPEARLRLARPGGRRHGGSSHALTTVFGANSQSNPS